MKKHWKTLIFAAAAAAVLACGTSAFAVSDVHATIYSRPVFVEGQQVWCWNPQGQQTDYLSYNGTTYIPIRTAGEWMGKNVAWDEATKTITLSGTAQKVYHGQTDSAVDSDTWNNLLAQGMTVRLRDDITVIVDGAVQDFKNAKGESVYPINYNDMNYLPVRNIGELLDMTVTYVPDTADTRSAIFLRTALTDQQIAQGKTYIQTLRNASSFSALDAAGAALPDYLRNQRGLDVSGVTGNPNSVDTEDNIFNLMLRFDDGADPSLDDIQQYAKLGKTAMQTLIDTPKPDVPVLDYYYNKMVAEAKTALSACRAVSQAVTDGQDQAACMRMMLQSTLDNMCVADLCSAVSADINYMELVLLEQY